MSSAFAADAGWYLFDGGSQLLVSLVRKVNRLFSTTTTLICWATAAAAAFSAVCAEFVSGVGSCVQTLLANRSTAARHIRMPPLSLRVQRRARAFLHCFLLAVFMPSTLIPILWFSLFPSLSRIYFLFADIWARFSAIFFLQNTFLEAVCVCLLVPFLPLFHFTIACLLAFAFGHFQFTRHHRYQWRQPVVVPKDRQPAFQRKPQLLLFLTYYHTVLPSSSLLLF